MGVGWAEVKEGGGRRRRSPESRRPQASGGPGDKGSGRKGSWPRLGPTKRPLPKGAGGEPSLHRAAAVKGPLPGCTWGSEGQVGILEVLQKAVLKETSQESGMGRMVRLLLPVN